MLGIITKLPKVNEDGTVKNFAFIYVGKISHFLHAGELKNCKWSDLIIKLNENNIVNIEFEPHKGPRGMIARNAKVIE